ncbi:MAG: TRAP-type C4-dicarboxylate transporter periplasmic solute-binding [Ignavibacteria bacterium]|nr:MAG: TRAP-type C4-dicarboxylate transporter periplasmic solute-binding [Ignavibacteria bacterium]
METVKKILIVDDHPLFRKGIKSVLAEDTDVKVIGEAGNSEEAMKLIEKETVDIVILDLQMPGMSGIELSKMIKSRYKNISIILLTMHKDERIFNNSLEYGLEAYILKENAVEEVLKAVHVVADGNFYLSPSMSEYMIQKSMKQKKLVDENPGIKNLSEKEKEILNLISQNKTTKEIAEALFVSYKTIENHRANICKKLNITGCNALLKFIIENKTLLS